MKTDNESYYGTISRFFHWSMALLFLFMLFTVTAPKFNEEYVSLLDYHKSIGFTIIVLCIIRLFWALKNFHKRPKSHYIAHIGHGLLYALMLWIPIVAILRQYGGARRALDIFGVQVIPTATERIDWMVKIADLHGEAGWILFVVAAGHIGAAIFHQIKGEKIINRMIGK